MKSLIKGSTLHINLPPMEPVAKLSLEISDYAIAELSGGNFSAVINNIMVSRC